MASYIEFPIFTGVSGDLRPWISWLEAFFVREKFTEDEKMNLAQSLLEGEANAWFYSSRKRFAFQSWEHLVVELLLWRFGAFGDGGVFSDLELFLLWNKYDRILRKRRKRMETTSITPQESISSPATIHETVSIDKFSNQQVDEISGEKKDESHEATLVKVLDNLEEASVTQNQVPVSKLEPSLQIPKDSPNVCENSQAVVGCEHQRSFQKNIRMDVVNGVVERSQRVMSITKNVSAHQVLDKTSAHKERLKPKSKRKLSLSLKTWKFKFKNKMLQRNRSQMDLHQFIDISKVTNSYPCFSVSFGLVRKKRTIQCRQLKKQAHNSRFLYQLRMLHDPGGKKVKHSDDTFETEVDIDKVQRTQRDTEMQEVLKLKAPVGLENQKKSRCLKASLFNFKQKHKRIKRSHNQQQQHQLKRKFTKSWSFKYKGIEEAVDIAQVTLLLQLFLDDLKSHMRHKWKSKHLRAVFDLQSNLSSALVVVNKPVTECKNTDAIFQLVLERTVSHEWHRWKHKPAYLQGLLEFVVFALVKLQDIDKEMGADPVTQAHKFTVEKFGRLHTTRLTVLRVLCLLGTLFWRTSFKKQKFGKNWWYKFKHGLWQRVCGKELLEVEVVVAETIVDVRFDDVDRRELLIKWQDHDASETSWLFSMAFVQSYHAFKLEDKLVFGEGSIDTIKQSYCRRKREESESSNAREVSSANRGFALTEYSNSREASDANEGFAVLFR